MANFGMMLLIGGGLTSFFLNIGDSSLSICMCEFSGVLVLGCGLGVLKIQE